MTSNWAPWSESDPDCRPPGLPTKPSKHPLSENSALFASTCLLWIEIHLNHVCGCLCHIVYSLGLATKSGTNRTIVRCSKSTVLQFCAKINSIWGFSGQTSDKVTVFVVWSSLFVSLSLHRSSARNQHSGNQIGGTFGRYSLDLSNSDCWGQ